MSDISNSQSHHMYCIMKKKKKQVLQTKYWEVFFFLKYQPIQISSWKSFFSPHGKQLHYNLSYYNTWQIKEFGHSERAHSRTSNPITHNINLKISLWYNQDSYFCLSMLFCISYCCKVFILYCLSQFVKNNIIKLTKNQPGENKFQHCIWI